MTLTGVCGYHQRETGLLEAPGSSDMLVRRKCVALSVDVTFIRGWEAKTQLWAELGAKE